MVRGRHILYSDINNEVGTSQFSFALIYVTTIYLLVRIDDVNVLFPEESLFPIFILSNPFHSRIIGILRGEVRRDHICGNYSVG